MNMQGKARVALIARKTQALVLLEVVSATDESVA